MYRFVRIAGRGVNGNVYLGERLDDWKLFALKKLSDTTYAKRELALWQRICPHDNIVNVIQVHKLSDTYLVSMDAMIMTLTQFIRDHRGTSQTIEWTFHQMLAGLRHCHAMDVLHRDVKPDNILLGNEGAVKLCDFSLSRFRSEDKMTNNVVTLWYRAPELLFGSTTYGSSIDVWSAICVLIEMMTKYPPFVAKKNNELAQLDSIMSILGTPTKDEMHKMGCNVELLRAQTGCKDVLFGKYPQFVSEVFVYNPEQRHSAEELMRFCKGLRVNFFPPKRHRASLSEWIPTDWEEIFCAIDEVSILQTK